MQDSCTVHIFYCIAKLAHCPRSIFSCQAQTEVAGTVLNNNFIFLLFTRISISSKVSWLCFISIFILAATAFTYVYKLQLQHQWKYRNWYRCRQYSACFFSIHNKLLSEPHINVKAAIFSFCLRSLQHDVTHTHTHTHTHKIQLYRQPSRSRADTCDTTDNLQSPSSLPIVILCNL